MAIFFVHGISGALETDQTVNTRENALRSYLTETGAHVHSRSNEIYSPIWGCAVERKPDDTGFHYSIPPRRIAEQEADIPTYSDSYIGEKSFKSILHAGETIKREVVSQASQLFLKGKYLKLDTMHFDYVRYLVPGPEKDRIKSIISNSYTLFSAAAKGSQSNYIVGHSFGAAVAYDMLVSGDLKPIDNVCFISLGTLLECLFDMGCWKRRILPIDGQKWVNVYRHTDPLSYAIQPFEGQDISNVEVPPGDANVHDYSDKFTMQKLAEAL